MLKFGFAEVVHRDIIRDSERIEADVTNVSLQVFWVREERKGRRLFLGTQRCGGTSCSGNFNNVR
jgi:hypothetical protein